MNWRKWIPLSETVDAFLKESSYWAQFKAGLWVPSAVAQLDNNLSEFLDLQGKVPMTERDYLEKVCEVSKLT